MDDLRVMTGPTRKIVIRAYDADGYVADDAAIGLKVEGRDLGRVEHSEGRAVFQVAADAVKILAYADYPGQEQAIETPSADAAECRIVFTKLHIRQEEGFLEKHFPAIIGIAFVLLAVVLGFVFSNPTPLQVHIVLAVLSLGGGGVASEIPGLLKVDLSLTQKFTVAASGALALFVILYFAVPAGTPGAK